MCILEPAVLVDSGTAPVSLPLRERRLLLEVCLGEARQALMGLILPGTGLGALVQPLPTRRAAETIASGCWVIPGTPGWYQHRLRSEEDICLQPEITGSSTCPAGTGVTAAAQHSALEGISCSCAPSLNYKGFLPTLVLSQRQHMPNHFSKSVVFCFLFCLFVFNFLSSL